MKKNKRISIKYLGNIYSNGSSGSNIDTFNIYSKSALFNYDNAKELNKQCVLIEENFNKSLKKKKYERYFPQFFNDIHIKKKNFFPHHWYMDDIGSVIDINLIKHPDIGEGIIYSPSYSMFNSAGAWLKPSFIKHFIKFNKPYDTIKIDDNKLCFGFFDDWDLDFKDMKEFFKKKNKKNIKEFQIYIKEKYDNIVKNRFGSDMYRKNEGSCVLECKVPNGKHKFYSLTSKTTFEDTSIEEDAWMGELILYKKK
jgi:hypothetical protein